MVTADWSEFLFINSAYEDIWGQPRVALFDDPTEFLQGVHPENRAAVTVAMEQRSDGEAVDIEFRVNAEEDFQRRVWVQAEPISDETGDPARIVGFVRDITERTERERTLTRMEYIVQKMNDGTVMVQDGVIKYANPASPRLWAMPKTNSSRHRCGRSSTIQRTSSLSSTQMVPTNIRTHRAGA